MTSFDWSRKIGDKVIKRASEEFERNSKDENEVNEEVDWISLLPKQRKVALLEDAASKSQRLKYEGEKLAEAERCWEAIRKWDEAIQLTPNDERLWEMKAQALLILCEVFPALHAAEKVLELNPRWWVGYQTLGRIQLGLGEVKLAIRSFSQAVHINPSESELWTEDLLWASSLLKKKKDLKTEIEENEQNNKLQITEIGSDTVGVNFSKSAAISLDPIPESSGKQIGSLPQNYVYMRHT